MQCIVGYCYKYTCVTYDCFCAPGAHLGNQLASEIWVSIFLIVMLPGLTRKFSHLDSYLTNIPELVKSIYILVLR